MPSSRLPGFHQLSPSARLDTLVEAGWLGREEATTLATALPVARLNCISESVVGPLTLPRSIVTNVRIENQDVLLPFATEEPSIVAACSKAGRLTRDSGGVKAIRRTRLALAQVLVEERTPKLRPHPDALRQRVADQAIIKHPRWAAAGGQVLSVELRALPVLEGPALCALDLTFNPGDSMGANLADSLASLLAADLPPDWANVLTSIVSNHPVDPPLEAHVQVPLEQLAWKRLSGREVGTRIQLLSTWAQLDPKRCVTHNKGVLNGIEALLLATYQDTRASASALLSAGQAGPRPLVQWELGGDSLAGRFVGTIPCGIVGGTAPTMPETAILWRWMRVGSALDLEVAAASAGLLQNLGALLALATEGIEAGHLRLHARKHAATHQ